MNFFNNYKDITGNTLELTALIRFVQLQLILTLCLNDGQVNTRLIYWLEVKLARLANQDVNKKECEAKTNIEESSVIVVNEDTRELDAHPRE